MGVFALPISSAHLFLIYLTLSLRKTSSEKVRKSMPPSQYDMFASLIACGSKKLMVGSPSLCLLKRSALHSTRFAGVERGLQSVHSSLSFQDQCAPQPFLRSQTGTRATTCSPASLLLTLCLMQPILNKSISHSSFSALNAQRKKMDKMKKFIF